MLGDADRAAQLYGLLLHFEAALRENERVGFRPWLAWTRYQYAQMLGARDAPGDRERVDGLLTGATDLASELGLEGLQRRIAGLSQSIASSAAR
jgi:hypothetical protein